MGQPCKWCGAPLTFRRSGERWIALEDGDLGLPARELDQVTGLTAENLKPHIDTLSRYGIATLTEDFDGRWWVATRPIDGWPFWSDLKSYCDRTGLGLSAFITELRFNLMD